MSVAQEHISVKIASKCEQFIRENAFQRTACKITYILARFQCVFYTIVGLNNVCWDIIYCSSVDNDEFRMVTRWWRCICMQCEIFTQVSSLSNVVQFQHRKFELLRFLLLLWIFIISELIATKTLKINNIFESNLHICRVCWCQEICSSWKSNMV